MKRLGALALTLLLGPSLASPACDKPVYLTFDTGHMGVAPLVAETLKRHGAKATFFLAQEPTQTGGQSLDDQWAPWWRERAREGHDFGSHTWEHDIWLEDLPDGRFRFRTVAGEQTPRIREMGAAEYCEVLQRSAKRFTEMTGQAMSPIFRAPGGRASPALLAAARACGFHHVGWSRAGFLGDELSSERHPNAQLLEKALRDIQPGDILMAHLGIWSRKDPWAPAVLEPLIQGLTARGMCFAPLRDHPRYGPLMRAGFKPRALPTQGTTRPAAVPAAPAAPHPKSTAAPMPAPAPKAVSPATSAASDNQQP